MDFMYLNKEDLKTYDFDAREELVKKDGFFDNAKKYISLNEETILHRQVLFADILKSEALADFLCALSEKLTEYEPLVTYHIKANNREEHVRNIQVGQQNRELAIANGICPKCGSNLVERKGRYGRFIGCSNYPQCNFTQKL